jgi:RNA polymerase sigma factor (sigma-70 family)
VTTVKPGWRQRFIATVVAHHGRPLRRFFVSRLPNAADAPDLLQEVYMRLLRLDRPDLVRCPEAYVFTIAANIAHEYNLKRSNRPVHIALDDFPPEGAALDTDPLIHPEPGPEDEAIRAERIRRLEGALAHLSPKARATLIWHRRDGYTYEEIAARLGISRNMVKKYLAQALAHCRNGVDRDTEG